MENNEKGVAADGRQKVKKHNQTKKKNSDKVNASQRAFVKGLRNRPTGGPTLTYDADQFSRVLFLVGRSVGRCGGRAVRGTPRMRSAHTQTHRHTHTHTHTQTNQESTRPATTVVGRKKNK